MTGERVDRRLAAVLAADVAGYSRLMGADEVGTLAALKAIRREIVDPAIAEHKGRLVKTTGDGLLVEFASAVDAVSCAIAVQSKMAERARGGATPLIQFRIGINVGDIIIDGGDIFGDGVNIAARVENESEPGKVYLSDDAYRQVRGKTSVEFEDMGERSLKNIERPIRVYAVRSATAVPAQAMLMTEGAKRLPMPDKPSIAVLPFQNMSGDPNQEYFGDGLVEDIITALSRFRGLFVVARNSSFTYKGRSVDIREVGRNLGVRYVLEGSVRKSADRIRITGQLIDSETGAHVWADRFDGSLEDIFEMQDFVTSSVVGAIAPKLDSIEIERARRKPVESLDAYDCYLRGIAQIHVSNKEALRLFYRAIELDPEFATPYGMAARCYLFRQILDRIVDREAEVAEVRKLSRRVAAIGQDDGLALTWAGLALFELCREYEAGETLVDQALYVNPNSAVGWVNRGAVSGYSGQHQAAIEHYLRAMRLSPVDLETYRAEFLLAGSYMHIGRLDEAVRLARSSFARRPGASNLVLIAASALAGYVAEARLLAVETGRIMPNLRVSNLRRNIAFRRPEDLDRFCEGFRLAGVPE